jgi:hypothetical protein
MKNLIILGLLLLALQVNAQYPDYRDIQLGYNKTDATVGIGVLAGTFIYYDKNRGLSSTQSNIIVASGIATSILSYYVISPTVRKVVIPKTQKMIHRLKRRHFKR